MTHYFARYSLILLIFFTSGDAFARKSVWKIENDQNVLFLAGTMHLLQEQDYPLPVEFDKAFNAAQLIIFETDTSKLQEPELQQALMSAMLNSGQNLKQQLTPATWQRLDKHMKTRGMSLQQFNNFKVAMVLVTLTVAEYQLMGFTSPGVDETYYQKALDHKKRIEFLETPQQQIAFLASMGEDTPNKMINYTLDDLADMPQYVSQLKTAWQNGDLNQLEASGLAEMRKEYPGVYETLISQRNKKWMQQIKRYMQTPETEAIYVGALHMAGNDGLIKQLKAQGYKVTQL